MENIEQENKKIAEEIIEKLNSAHLSSDECKQILGALEKQPEVIGSVIYTVADAQDYVACAVAYLMLPDEESYDMVVKEGLKRFCKKFHSYFMKEVVVNSDRAMYNLATRETSPKAFAVKAAEKRKKVKRV